MSFTEPQDASIAYITSYQGKHYTELASQLSLQQVFDIVDKAYSDPSLIQPEYIPYVARVRDTLPRRNILLYRFQLSDHSEKLSKEELMDELQEMVELRDRVDDLINIEGVLNLKVVMVGEPLGCDYLKQKLSEE